MLNGLGQSYGTSPVQDQVTNLPSFYPTMRAQNQITNLASFYPTAPYEPPVQGQITDLASFYPTGTVTPLNYGTLAPSNSGADLSTALTQAAIAAGVTPTQFTQQAVSAGYTPTQWAAMTAAQRQAALQSGAVHSGAPSPLSAANMTPILLVGGAVLLLVMMRK